jgi:hypothetical protein
MDKNRIAEPAPAHHDPADENRPGAVLTTQESRQGETSGHMRYVLAGSLGLAIIAGVMIYVYFF